MQEEKLKKVQQSIHENWGLVKPFIKLPKNYFNCYMFAVCNAFPTEIPIAGKYGMSVIGEKVSYFGSIGKISETNYKTLPQYKQALINDLDVLGISAKECDQYVTLDNDSILIAFFSNFKKGKATDFHFLRYIPEKNRWMGKEGWPGDLQWLPNGWPIEQICVKDQERIGLFKLTLR